MDPQSLFLILAFVLSVAGAFFAGNIITRRLGKKWIRVISRLIISFILFVILFILNLILLDFADLISFSR